MHNLRERPHAFFVYGIMHYYVETLMQALSEVHVHAYVFVFIEINVIFTIHNINSVISYLVVTRSSIRLKFAIKIEFRRRVRSRFDFKNR